jgi:hypothetical protein
MNFSSIFCAPWQKLGYNVIFQPCCQTPPYLAEPGQSAAGWPLIFPNVVWKNNTVVVMQCFDFLTVHNSKCVELCTIEKYFGSHSNRVIVLHWDIGLDRFYSGPLNLVYFPCHSYDVIFQINQIQHQWQDHFTQPRNKVWQCLNGRICDHRQNVVDILKHYPNGTLSLGNDIALSTWPYSTYQGTENEDNWMRLMSIYADCSINVVTETIYKNSLGVITEKTIMAFLALQIPILIGYPGIVDHCEKLGFDMFRDIVDTTYDYLPNDIRVNQAIFKNQDILKNGIDREKLSNRLIKNQQWAQHGWPQRLVDYYNSRVTEIANCLTNSEGPHTAKPSLPPC